MSIILIEEEKMAQHEEKQLLDRVIALTSEATGLPRSPIGTYRREQIEWELMKLYRRFATLFENPKGRQVLTQMWSAIETHVDDALARERIKQAWLRIPG